MILNDGLLVKTYYIVPAFVILGLACFIYDYYFLMRMDFWSDLDTTIFIKCCL